MPDTDETALEKTFSDLAYSHLRDKGQALLDYLVGFQMLKQEDEGQRAVGIFGFEIDEDFYYAPVFFLNGEVRGLDTLYSVKSDLFVPLTEEWINNTINRRQQTLGEANMQTRTERGVHVPNYTRLKVIPGGAGAINLKLSQACVISSMGGMNEKLASLAVPSLTAAIREAGLGPMFKRALDECPQLEDAFAQFGYDPLDLLTVDPPQAKMAQDKAVIIINTVTDEGVDQLTDKQREEVLGGGAVVMDKRPDVEKAFVYPSETRHIVSNPTGGGLYDVIWSDGATTLCLVCPVDDGRNHVFVYCTETKKYCTISGRQVYVTRAYNRDELMKWLDDNADTPSACKGGQVVVFVSDEGLSTPAFCIKDKLVGVDDLTVLSINDAHATEARDTACCDPCPGSCGSNGRGVAGNPPTNMFRGINVDALTVHWYGSTRPRNPARGVSQIIVAETGGAGASYTKNQLVVNDRRFWALKINSFRMTDNDHYQTEKYDEKPWDALLAVQDFGDVNTVCSAIKKVATAIKTWSANDEVTIKVGSAVDTARNQGDALRVLMLKHGMAESDARHIWCNTGPLPYTWWFRPASKTAAQLLEMPDPQDTSMGGFLSSFHTQQVPFETINQSQPPLDNREFYRYSSPFGGGSDAESGGEEGAPNTLQMVQQAAQTGQKEVFDAAALGSLIKSHNPTDLVDRFLPTVISGMDRIGRMLFLIYWHYDAFEERYGEDDLSEFMDNLKSVFEQLGDVVIFAKKRTLSGDPDHYGLGVKPAMEDAG